MAADPVARGSHGESIAGVSFGVVLLVGVAIGVDRVSVCRVAILRTVCRRLLRGVALDLLDAKHLQRNVPKPLTDLFAGDAARVFFAVDVEHVHPELERDEGLVGGDKRRQKPAAGRRAVSGLDLDVVEVRLSISPVFEMAIRIASSAVSTSYTPEPRPRRRLGSPS